MKPKEVRLYNVLFPFWMLMLFPTVWLIVLPGNFLIDSLVLLIALRCLGIDEKKLWYKRHILKIFTFGMLSDLVGAAYMLLLMMRFDVGNMGDELYLTLPAILLAATLIFLSNYYITFRKVEKPLRLKLALTFAIVTAPYTFLVPSSWLY